MAAGEGDRIGLLELLETPLVPSLFFIRNPHDIQDGDARESQKEGAATKEGGW